MSGNTTSAGLHIGQSISPRPNTVCLPIPVFLFGILALLLPALMLVVFAMLDRPANSGV